MDKALLYRQLHFTAPLPPPGFVHWRITEGTGRKRGRIGEECMRVAEVGVGLSGELEEMGMSDRRGPISGIGAKSSW